MDALSVGASIIGLLVAGGQIGSLISTLIARSKECPALAQNINSEVLDVSAALGSLQDLINNRVQVATGRGDLILLDQLLTALTGCVTTYSDLQFILNGLCISEDIRMLDRIKWLRQEDKLNTLLQRLQNHKLSLTLMLTTMQCKSMAEAQRSTQKLCSLVEQMLASNRDLAERIRGLERDGSIISTARDSIMGDKTSTIRPDNILGTSMLQSEETFVERFAFEDALKSSRVYNRAIYRHSQLSLTSTALHRTALSVFSKLSLSQISSISFYALPVCAIDLSNSECYVFGDEGALLAEPTINSSPQHRTDNSVIKEHQSPVSNDAVFSLAEASSRAKPKRRGLLGRFATPQRRISIDLPTNPMHVTHVGYDHEAGIFTGLPKEWKRIIQDQGIVELTQPPPFERPRPPPKVPLRPPRVERPRPPPKVPLLPPLTRHNFDARGSA